ncbi:MAG: methylenetetrahydrofolate reductase C-terminal domain-containing protein [Gammaproteobacteria bacterium]|nr:methylenetetrahydrofolate reductase C-terminal domain-containing protein [Gammaproteobacteria bacterium]
MYAVRRWSVRHARFLEGVYNVFEAALVGLNPLWNTVGYARLERPVAALERLIKGFLFDCQMCGQCVLSDTGLSCPMNCPKQLRNGPCGGVRPNGNCEVKPEMRCVWVDAWEGSRRMRNGDGIHSVQVAVDFSLAGRSSWLKVARERQAGRSVPGETEA